MVRKILPNNNEKCYRNFSPKIFASKHALIRHFKNLGESKHLKFDQNYGENYKKL
jgi:hypothetical protein